MKDLTPDERLLVERTREFAQVHVSPNAARWSRERTTCAELFPLAARLGLLGLQVPLSDGGSAMSFACKVQIAETLAAADFGVAMALINTHNVAEQLARLGQSSSMLIGRFSQALMIPESSFLRSKCSRRLSFLITNKETSSTYS